MTCLRSSRNLSWLLLVGTVLLGTVLIVGVSFAQEAGVPLMRAHQLDQAPEIDGEVLTDTAWSGVEAAGSFRQTTPDEGEPASEQTNVFVGYTADTLYIGVVCFDGDSSAIISTDSRRDSSLSESDSIQLILDTFGDRQSGFVFGTNPAGLQYDGQVTNEGSGGFGSGGGAFNLNWDTPWEVRTKTSDIGWSAEFAIPFRSLRYGRGKEQVWGINFQRNIRRRNETAFWAPLPRQFGLLRLSLAGRLEGVEVPPRRHLELTPYALVAASESGDASTDTQEEIGFDLKYGLTPSLTLDVTYNTDFAQVEVDEQQINLDRFSLFFPEKRPFFLENAGRFAVGVPGEIELFFSRRIGIGPGGQAIPIVGGARVTGKVGDLNVGVLRMRSERLDGVAPRNDFSVLRLSRELPNRSSFGGLFVERQSELTGDVNRTYGLDGRWGIGEYGYVTGFVAGTETPGATEGEYAYRLGAGADTEDWSYAINVTEVAQDFNPEVGFLARSNYRKGDFFVLRRHRPEKLWGLHEIRPHISFRGFWGPNDFQETGFLHIDNHWEWPSGFEIHTGINFTREGIREPFEISEGVVVQPGTYDHREALIVLFTNQSAPLSLNLRTTIGGFFGGDRMNVTPTLRYRKGDTLSTELSWSYNDIDLPVGDFEAQLARLRVSYSFTPKRFIQGLVQYNDRADLVAANLRFGWLGEAGTGLFVVYNEQRPIGGGERERALIVKYSRLLQLLR